MEYIYSSEQANGYFYRDTYNTRLHLNIPLIIMDKWNEDKIIPRGGGWRGMLQ